MSENMLEKNIENTTSQGQPEPQPEEEGKVLQALSLSYKSTFDDVMSALNEVDKITGAAKRTKAICNVIMVVVALYIIAFLKDHNGVSLVFACIFAMLALFAKKRSLSNNAQLAKAFEEEDGQHLTIGWKEADINGTTVTYREIKRVMEFEESYVIQYQENRFLPVPKRLLTEEENRELGYRLRGLLDKDYQDYTSKS